MLHECVPLGLDPTVPVVAWLSRIPIKDGSARSCTAIHQIKIAQLV